MAAFLRSQQLGHSAREGVNRQQFQQVGFQWRISPSSDKLDDVSVIPYNFSSYKNCHTGDIFPRSPGVLTLVVLDAFSK